MDYLQRTNYRYFKFGNDIKTPANSNIESHWRTILNGLCIQISPNRYTTFDESGVIDVELHKGCVSVTRNGKTTIYLDQESLLRVISWRVYYLDVHSIQPPRKLYVPLCTTPKDVWHTVGHIYNYPFYGTVFCYTHESDGFMMCPSKFHLTGQIYTVSAIESDL